MKKIKAKNKTMPNQIKQGWEKKIKDLEFNPKKEYRVNRPKRGNIRFLILDWKKYVMVETCHLKKEKEVFNKLFKALWEEFSLKK